MPVMKKLKRDNSPAPPEVPSELDFNAEESVIVSRLNDISTTIGGSLVVSGDRHTELTEYLKQKFSEIEESLKQVKKSLTDENLKSKSLSESLFHFETTVVENVTANVKETVTEVMTNKIKPEIAAVEGKIKPAISEEVAKIDKSNTLTAEEVQYIRFMLKKIGFSTEGAVPQHSASSASSSSSSWVQKPVDQSGFNAAQCAQQWYICLFSFCLRVYKLEVFK